MTATDLSDRDYEALARFRHSLRVFLSFSEAAARNAGLPPAQHQLLLAIRGWPGEGEPTIGDVADLLVLRHHSVVELVQRATAAGLIIAVPDQADGRRQRLQLTEAGATKLADLSALHRDELRLFRTELSPILHELG